MYIAFCPKGLSIPLFPTYWQPSSLVALTPGHITTFAWWVILYFFGVCYIFYYFF